MQRVMLTKRQIAASLLLFACMAGFIQAEQLFYSSDLQGTRAVRGADPYEVGGKFVTGSTPPTITALGFIDLKNTNPTAVPSGDGLVEAHRVTLWLDSGGTKVTEVIVPAGDKGVLIDGFRYAAIPEKALTLLPNTAYVVSASTTAIKDKWVDDYAASDPTDTADKYFVGANGRTTWQPRWGTTGTRPNSSWHSSVFYGLVNITSERLFGAYGPSVIQTEDEVNKDVNAVFKWKASKDSEKVYAVDPNIERQDVYLSPDQNVSTDTKLYYIGSDSTVSLTDPNSLFPESGHRDLNLDGSYNWAVVTIIDTGKLTLPDVGDPLSDMTDPNHLVSEIWSFDTIASVPEITDPLDDAADFPGQGVSFTIAVSSISQEHYKWFKSVDDANDTPGDDTAAIGDNDSGTLTMTLPTNPNDYSDYEGYYYCKISNDSTVGGGGANPDVLSNVAKLAIKRQMAYWTMDQDDFVGNQYLDKSTEDATADNADPNYPAGVTFAAGPYSLGATSAVPVNDSSFGVVNGALAPTQYTNQITISAWIHLTGTLTDADGHGILTKGNGVVGNYDDNIQWAFYARTRGSTPTPTVRFTSWAGGDAWSEQGSVPANEWVHVAASVNQGVATVYVNGVASGYTYSNFTFGGNLSDPVRIGRYGAGGNNFPGEIDDIRVYNYGMDKHGIADLYNAVSGINVCIDDYVKTFDFDKNCKINLNDFSEFAKIWLLCGLYPDCP